MSVVQLQGVLAKAALVNAGVSGTDTGRGKGDEDELGVLGEEQLVKWGSPKNDRVCASSGTARHVRHNLR